ncbi:MAG: tRNA 2-thiouridine(34) synthase MnmA, partial [Candidatus Edwardsbacteria bacterium]|nr:tRNA 2-thiouridine(34) synthase MnmA [Candidatus Edwardsbacteria bacterium]
MKGPATSVAVAMSGGVDSGVAAALLVRRGCRVVGLTMKLFCHDGADRARSCCSLDSIAAARQAAQALGIPHYVVDCQREFSRSVVDRFVAEYAAGRTPNPCVDCNAAIKFGLLLDKARALGCRYLATGHYARIVKRRGTSVLARGLDDRKDQSYFLWPLTSAQLSQALFPLGGLTKQEVRAQARSLALISAERPESQELCFVQHGSYQDFLAQRVRPVPGDIVDADGKVLGRHQGIIRYTVGQREGLGIALGRPQYVL